ncbi:DNA ligase [Trypanosoma cruzi]|uniref:DNA ligase n=2 Tax=Trypanosoma cruzi TaxID=5693 RepID=V5DAB4_TRYCR|nr:DNA ligase [Trypanosoma cruzi Dm28c]PBJ77424.1 DNA ligase,mitochondrial DNA ligase-like protein [Trypanosoma cruzi cruzi]PWU99845.1 putative DNA ligase [Trypanosoma cruzi]RNF17278.1 DNA ligase [Trypanosoma cruzi]
MKACQLRLSFLFALSALRMGRVSRTRLPITPPANLATFHPAIASSWMTAASNKLLQPQHVLPTSRKLAWWRCPHCGHEHHKRIDLHVAAGGVCPRCQRMPTLLHPSDASSAVLTIPLVKHRCRPDNSLSVLAAANANRVKSSIADDGYLRVVETRNLQPMLARNFEKESDTIDDDAVLFVSPKLDGVRCIVAWNVRERRPCFFSRSGTLFECCDHRIEPRLRPLFEKDPNLVLDGELYNHNVDDFEQLISAIRTTRDRRTPAIAKLQEQLQYHAFDIMYASKFPDMSVVPFSERHKHLGRLIHGLASSKGQVQEKAVVLVPAAQVKKADIPRLLRLSLADGYEGIIVRRDGVVSARGENNCSRSGTSRGVNKSSSRGLVVGYAYGARSPNLLKYKVMQDDEYVIVSGVEGRGKWKGCLGAFVCRTKRGHQFTVAPATTEQRKKDMWQRLAQYKGKMLTVQYQELSANGVPRFPIGKCVRGAKSGKDWI